MRRAIAFLLMVTAARAHAGGIIDLGDADAFTISQPVVQTRVGTFDTFLNEYLLDTGASGILVGSSASDELKGLGLQTVATYTDFGVAGPETTRVSAPYDFHFAGSNGVPLTLPATRIQTSKGDFSFYSGIAGMPLMMNRTVGLDLAAQADPDVLRIGVSFGSGPPPTGGRQYAVPLSLVEFPATGQANPGDPLPVAAPLPFVPVQVTAGSHRLAGNFLLDTGAQQCILSSRAAFDLGLDKNGDGSFDDEATSFQTVAGVGGSVAIPVLSVDAVALRATGGVDLSLGHVDVGIVDIDPAISGVLGMNVLNTGWEVYALNTFLGMPPGTPGLFDRVDLDFRAAAATMQGELRLTMNAERFATSPWHVAAGSTLALGPQVPATIASLVNNGLVDVGLGRLTVTTGLTGDAVAAAILAVLGGGTSGITSSAAVVTPFRAVGWLDNGDGSVTFGYAAEGDTNLDGLVDVGDLQNILASGKYGTGQAAVWADGDFNFDGVVDVQDLQDILASGVYGQGGYNSAPLSRSMVASTRFGGGLVEGGSPSGPTLALGPVTAVPEPSGAVLLVAAMVGASVVWRRRVGKSFGW